MLTIKKKNKLISVLKKLGDTSFAESRVLNDLSDQIESIKESLPSPYDDRGIVSRVQTLNVRYESLSKTLVAMVDFINGLVNEVRDETKAREIEKKLKEFSALLEDTKKELMAKIFMTGGGSKPLQVSVGSIVANNRYADINIISSGATVANNDTTKKTDITFSSSGSSFQVPISGIIDGVNTVFVWATAPNALVVDQGRAMQKTNSSPDLNPNWTGTTTTTLQVAPNFDIFAIA